MFRLIAVLPNISDIGKNEKRKIINILLKYTLLKFFNTYFVCID